MVVRGSIDFLAGEASFSGVQENITCKAWLRRAGKRGADAKRAWAGGTYWVRAVDAGTSAYVLLEWTSTAQTKEAALLHSMLRRLSSVDSLRRGRHRPRRLKSVLRVSSTHTCGQV